MCHIILALPFISLLLFYFLPFNTAIAVYLPILFLSLFVYYKIKKAMDLPPKGGMDEMLGAEGEIVDPLLPEGRIRVKDVLWYARSEKPLREGDKGRITGFDGLTLIVEPVTRNSKASKEIPG